MARLVQVNASTARRLNQRLGEHGQHRHQARVQAVEVETLDADERCSYATYKDHLVWEGELMDPASKFVLFHEQGSRNEALIRRLLQGPPAD